MVVSGVLGDVGMSPTADILRSGQGCESVVRGVSVVGDVLVSSEVGESDSMECPVVMGCVPVSAMTSTRFGALHILQVSTRLINTYRSAATTRRASSYTSQFTTPPKAEAHFIAYMTYV